MKYIFFIFLFTFLFFQFSLGQNQNSNINDSLKVEKLFRLMEEYEYSNADTAIYYCKNALNLSKAINNKRLEAYSLYYLGGLYDIQGIYKTAYDYYFNSLKIFEEINDKKGMGGCFNCIGIVLWEQSEQALSSVKEIKLTKSIQYNDKALIYYEEIEYRSGIATTLMNRGIIFDDFAKLTNDITIQIIRYKEAIKSYKRAVSIFNEIGDSRSTGDCNLNIASLYLNLYFNDEDTLFTKDEYIVVDNYLNNSLKLYYESNDLYGISMCLGQLADIKVKYASSNKLKKSYFIEAINYAKKSLTLSDSVDALFLKYDAYFVLFKAYKEIDKFKEALKYHELYLNTKDSVHKTEQLDAIEEMETKYQTEKKNVEIKELNIQKIKDGNIQRFFIIIISVLIFAAGMIIIFFRQRIKTNKILKYKNSQLNQLNSTQNRLMSIISHDFKAPLSAFYSITSSLKTKFDKIERKEIDNYFNRMLNSSVALKLQLENMLNWAINQSREIIVSKNNLNLYIVAYKVVMILQEFANEKSIEIKNTIPEDTEIYTDGKLLSIVLNNLIANAVKFSKSNSKIIISGKNENDKVILSVKDFGIGMSEKDAQNLFSSISNTAQNKNSGTGLGLIVSKDIIGKLGGKIWAKSELNIGTEIFIELK